MLRCGDACVHGAGGKGRLATEIARSIIPSTRMARSLGRPLQLPLTRISATRRYISSLRTDNVLRNLPPRSTAYGQPAITYRPVPLLLKNAAALHSTSAPSKSVETTEQDEEAADAREFASESQKQPGGLSKLDREHAVRRAYLLQRSIEKELLWTGSDRVLLVERTKQILRDGEYEKALELVRAAQKSGIDCIAAWNALLGWHMENGESTMAFKLFNDMKKRGRKPNAQTYTVMLNGYAQSPSPSAVRAAMSLYESLDSDANTKASVIHTNALLTVCSRKNDMDALWEIAGGLAETGPNAPDARTYTILLNAIRMSAENEVSRYDEKSQDDGIMEVRVAAVEEGKQLWADIVRRWKAEELTLDQPLVSAMGRLLISPGRPSDCNDVLALINQATGADFDFANHLMGRLDSVRASKEGRQNGDVPATESTPATSNVFEPIVMHGGKKPQFVEPTNDELSLLMDAFTRGRASIGRKLWNALTGEKFNIEPDSESFHQYLRFLRVNRASNYSLRVIRDQMAPSKQTLSDKTFIIAMSTCLRDRKNRNAFGTAAELLEFMLAKLQRSHPTVLEMYLELVSYLMQNEHRMAHIVGLGDPNNKSKKSPQEIIMEGGLRAVDASRQHIRWLKRFLDSGRVDDKSVFSAAIFDDGEPLNTRVMNHVIRDVNKADNSRYMEGAVKVLLNAKYLYTRLLKPDIKPLLPEERRVWLEKATKSLSVYSNQEYVDGVVEQGLIPLPFEPRRSKKKERSERGERTEKSERIERSKTIKTRRNEQTPYGMHQGSRWSQNKFSR
ncbi:hypothetical protein AJ80_01247 [Polytolypa hystricis UAMH7299]|uniref:Pentatricopeptide repeat protein n=1 Tax=Polytolypa hystricis (strain UAMH7299) TaxID=1447883 RepID=A0A2B7Z156_POLH7|nr:hypothetical protein AJ80_01247 [Polytolypa hystricis UAMH7299]